MNIDFSDLFDEAFEEQTQKRYPPPAVQIGTHIQSGSQLSLPFEKFASTHTCILGSTRAGKTKLMEGILRPIIEHGYGCVVLDGKGDLYDDLVSCFAYLDLEKGLGLAERTTLIDPNEDLCVGINYLELMGNDQRPSDLAGLVLEALKKFFKEDNETKVWLEEWGMAALVPLIKAKFTLLEAFEFLNLDDPRFRDKVIKQMGEGFYEGKWNRLKGYRRTEQEMRLGAMTTRIDRFWQDETLKVIFGQQKTTIDWLKVMNEGGIVLAKLGRTPRVPDRTADLIGSAILHQVTTLAPDKDKNRPFFFVADEFQKFATSDFSEALSLMKGFGISFILAHQFRGQLEKESPEILRSIDTNCDNKFVFRCSYEDAESVRGPVFSGEIHTAAEETKDETYQTKHRPILTYKPTVSYSDSESRSHTESADVGLSHSKSKGKSTSKAKGTSTSTSHGTSDSVSHSKTKGRATTVSHGRASTTFTGRSSGTATTINPNVNTDPLDVFFGGGEIVTNSEGESSGRAETESHAEAYTESESDTVGRTKTKSFAVGFSESEVDTIGENESESDSHSFGRGEANTVGGGSSKGISLAPFHEQEEYQELTSRSTYPLDEVKERLTALIKNQKRRSMLWKFMDNPPVSVFTPTVESPPMTESIRRSFKDTAYAHSALPTERVVKEIEDRVPQFMREVEDTKKESTENTKGSAGPTDEELNEPI